MKKTCAIILSLLFTFVSLGGSIFVHHCSHKTFLSLYAQFSEGHCPLCSKNHNPYSSKDSNEKDCKDGHCKDIEIKIDQPEETIVASSNILHIVSPAILPRLWVGLATFFTPKNIEEYHAKEVTLLYSNSSPPPYLLNCIFRI